MTIELLIASCEVFRSVRWIKDWLGWLDRVLSRWSWWDGPFGVALTLAVPSVIVALLFNWLSDGPAILAVAMGVCLLLLMLGPRDLNREIECYLVAYPGTDPDVISDAETSFLKSADIQPGELDHAVLGAISTAAHDRLFAPLFWFFILGPCGPVIYRMTAVLREQEIELESFSFVVERLYQVLIWVPIRLFIFGFGLAGTLTPILDAWREQDDLSPRSSETLLREAGLAAVNYGRLEQMIRDDPHIYWVKSMYALVKRTFTLWLVLVAIITLVAI